MIVGLYVIIEPIVEFHVVIIEPHVSILTPRDHHRIHVTIIEPHVTIIEPHVTIIEPHVTHQAADYKGCRCAFVGLESLVIVMVCSVMVIELRIGYQGNNDCATMPQGPC